MKMAMVKTAEIAEIARLPVWAAIPTTARREEVERVSRQRVRPDRHQLANLSAADVERAPGPTQYCDDDEHHTEMFGPLALPRADAPRPGRDQEKWHRQREDEADVSLAP
ncbi:hypothetical protein [Aureimonas altamirensis]|uniref:hypothetical protein n=1 Tax=Aureimonas altamirensis TaxID=370622 RepID=UPI003016625E